MNRLMTAITQTGISELFINKIDVLDEVKIFKFVLNGEIVEYKSIEGMITVIDELIYKHNPNIKIYVSGNPTGNDIHYS